MLVERLKKHVYALSHEIGGGSVFEYGKLVKAAGYITEEFRASGYDVEFQRYRARNKIVKNIIVTKKGDTKPDEIIVLGAHYDTKRNPGADDNASGVAGLLEIARVFRNETTARTIKFIAFVNEERPFYKTKAMGSRVYIRSVKENREKITGALILDMIGYYSSVKDFIVVVANTRSKGLLKRTIVSFRKGTGLTIKWFVLPRITVGFDLSDNWSFWKEGYPALMMTDTALFRNPHYHKASDTHGTLDYKSMSEVVRGVSASLRALTN